MAKNKRLLTALVMLGVCMGLFTGCRIGKEAVNYADRQVETKIVTLSELSGEETVVLPENAGAAANSEQPEKRPGDFSDSCAGTYAYDLLSDAEKSWYRGINAVLLTRSDDCVELSEEGLAAGLTQDDVDHIFQAVLIDHPEYFYVTGYQYTRYTRADKLVRVEFLPTYSIDYETAVARKGEIEAAAAAILAQAPLDGSDYDKVKFVYDYVIRNTEYNLNAPENQNIYSVLCAGESVCQGYAKTVQLLLNRMGVECTLVLGYVDGGEGHAWNLVKVDGEYYYVDATWGDASYYSSTGEELSMDFMDVSYDYLCVTTKELFKTHTVSDNMTMPTCSATNANYYVRNGAYFIAYDKDQLQSLIDGAILNGETFVTIKCANDAAYYEMNTKLIDEQEIFEYLDGSYHSLGFSQNDQQLSLTFWMTK